jgi:hypothetical protein
MNKTHLLENALASYQAAANELIAELKRQRNDLLEENAMLRADIARNLLRDTPETDAFIVQNTTNEGPTGVKWRSHAERLERDLRRAERKRDEAMEQNAKLRDIIKRAINFGEDRAPYLAYPGPTWEKLRAELEKLKEGGE